MCILGRTGTVAFVDRTLNLSWTAAYLKTTLKSIRRLAGCTSSVTPNSEARIQLIGGHHARFAMPAPLTHFSEEERDVPRIGSRIRPG